MLVTSITRRGGGFPFSLPIFPEADEPSRTSAKNLPHPVNHRLDCLWLDIAALLRRGILGRSSGDPVRAVLPAPAGAHAPAAQLGSAGHADDLPGRRHPAADPDHDGDAAGR